MAKQRLILNNATTQNANRLEPKRRIKGETMIDTQQPPPTRHGGGFHRSRKILGHDGERFGPQEGLLYHFIPKQKFYYFKIFLKCRKMP